MFDESLCDLVMKQRQQDILEQARRDQRARLVRPSRSRFAELPAQLLAVLGRMFVALGYRLQSPYMSEQECVTLPPIFLCSRQAQRM